MKLRFPGTRGEIDIKNRSHHRHSCLLVEESVSITMWKRTSYGRDGEIRFARLLAIGLLKHCAGWILMVSLVKGKAVEELGAKPVDVSRLKMSAIFKPHWTE